MTDDRIIGIVAAAFLLFCLGIVVGITAEEKISYDRCVKANPTVPVGEIRAFCEYHLYYKGDE